MKAVIKNSRLLLIFLGSLGLFLFMEFSERVNNTIISLAESSSSRAFGVYIVIHIFKYAALLFCIISFLLLFKVIFLKKA